MASVLLHLHGDSFSRRYQLASHALTAAASGDRVTVVLWFEPLVRHVRGGFDDPLPGEDRLVGERHAALGLPPPSHMLAEARTLGARVVACETAVRLAGLEPAEARARVDDLPGLQELLALARDAGVLLYL